MPLVAHTTLLEISCRSSFIVMVNYVHNHSAEGDQLFCSIDFFLAPVTRNTCNMEYMQHLSSYHCQLNFTFVHQKGTESDTSGIGGL